MKIIILLGATNNLRASVASLSLVALRTDLTCPRGGYVIYSTACEHIKRRRVLFRSVVRSKNEFRKLRAPLRFKTKLKALLWNAESLPMKAFSGCRSNELYCALLCSCHTFQLYIPPYGNATETTKSCAFIFALLSAHRNSACNLYMYISKSIVINCYYIIVKFQ